MLIFQCALNNVDALHTQHWRSSLHMPYCIYVRYSTRVNAVWADIAVSGFLLVHHHG